MTLLSSQSSLFEKEKERICQKKWIFGMLWWLLQNSESGILDGFEVSEIQRIVVVWLGGVGVW